MRHFIGYSKDGIFNSVETYAPGGWPRSCDFCQDNCRGLEDPNCNSPSVVSLRNKQKPGGSRSNTVGWILYDCPCPVADKRCNHSCYSIYMSTHHIDVITKEVVNKIVVETLIDGGEVISGSVIDGLPITIVKMKLKGDLVPDGAVINVATGNGADITLGDDSFELQFSGGTTQEVELVVPSHGLKGRISIFGKHIAPINLILRGWGI